MNFIIKLHRVRINSNLIIEIEWTFNYRIKKSRKDIIVRGIYMKTKNYICMDVFEFLRPEFGLELKTKPLFYSVSGFVIYVDKDKLNQLRELSKENYIVHNPTGLYKLTLLDLRDFLKTFKVNFGKFSMVDMTIFSKEEEISSLLRGEEFFRIHCKKIDQFSFLNPESSKFFEPRKKYFKKFITYENFKLINSI